MSNSSLIKRLAGLPISHMFFDSESLCIDFANTVSWRGSNRPNDRLQNLDDLMAWSICVGVLSPEQVASLYQDHQKELDASITVVREARALRESIYRIFSSISEDATPAHSDISRLRATYTKAISHAIYVSQGNHYVWKMPTESPDVRRIIWAVAISAVEIMGSIEIARVRRCQNEECSFLFIDRTRNASRLWCASDICGNRVRVRRHYNKVTKRK